MSDDVQYLRDTELPQKLDKLLCHILRTKPKDPMATVADLVLREISKQAKGKDKSKLLAAAGIANGLARGLPLRPPPMRPEGATVPPAVSKVESGVLAFIGLVEDGATPAALNRGMAKLFKSIDANGTKTIEPPEMEAVLEILSDVVDVPVGFAKQLQAAGPLKYPQFATIVKQVVGHMTGSSAPPPAPPANILPFPVPSSKPPTGSQETIQRFLEDAAANGWSDEADLDARIEDVFGAIDKDNSGFIGAAEWEPVQEMLESELFIDVALPVEKLTLPQFGRMVRSLLPDFLDEKPPAGPSKRPKMQKPRATPKPATEPAPSLTPEQWMELVPTLNGVGQTWMLSMMMGQQDLAGGIKSWSDPDNLGPLKAIWEKIRGERPGISFDDVEQLGMVLQMLNTTLVWAQLASMLIDMADDEIEKEKPEVPGDMPGIPLLADNLISFEKFAQLWAVMTVFGVMMPAAREHFNTSIVPVIMGS